MAIVDKLNQLEADIRDAYDSVTEKGGVVPVNQNTHNIATAIDSIPTTPTFTSNGFANDSWETICAIADAGRAPEYYNLGDWKEVPLSAVTDSSEWGVNITSGTIKIRIVSFDTVPLENGKKGHMTFLVWCTVPSNNVTTYEYKLFHHSLPYAVYSWAGAGAPKDWMNNTFRNALPTTLKNNLKKTVQTYYNNYSQKIVTEARYVTIPNLYQLGLDNYQNFNGVNGSYMAIRNLQTEKPFTFFAEYLNRKNYNGNAGDYYTGTMITSADTCTNWYFTRFTIANNAVNYTGGAIYTVDSNSDAWFYPTFTI